jgi:hypothetical protein
MVALDGGVHVDGHAMATQASAVTGGLWAGQCGGTLAGSLLAFDTTLAAVTVHAAAGGALAAVRGRARALASELLEPLPAAQPWLRCALEARSADRGAQP